MTFYIYFFLITWLGFYLSYFDKKREKYYFFLFIFISIAIFSLRYQVGGDWKRYELVFDQIILSNQENFFFDFFAYWMEKESLHNFIRIVAKQISNNINLYYFIMSCIFFLNLIPFFIKLKYPLLSLTISIPFTVYLLHLGFIRQSIALSFILVSFCFLIPNKKIFSFLFLFIGFGFHSSILVFFPIYIYRFLNIYFETKTKIYLFLILILSLGILSLILPNSIELLGNYFNHNKINLIFFNSSLITSYLYGNEYYSNGVYLRLLPSYIGFLIFLFNYNQFTKTNYIYFVDFGLVLFIFILVLLALGFSTAADRLNYYLAPFNLIGLIYFCTHNKNQLLLRSSIIVFIYFLILLLWLNFSNFSQSNWQPFKTL